MPGRFVSPPICLKIDPLDPALDQHLVLLLQTSYLPVRLAELQVCQVDLVLERFDRLVEIAHELVPLLEGAPQLDHFSSEPLTFGTVLPRTLDLLRELSMGCRVVLRRCVSSSGEAKACASVPCLKIGKQEVHDRAKTFLRGGALSRGRI